MSCKSRSTRRRLIATSSRTSTGVDPVALVRKNFRLVKILGEGGSNHGVGVHADGLLGSSSTRTPIGCPLEVFSAFLALRYYDRGEMIDGRLVGGDG